MYRASYQGNTVAVKVVDVSKFEKNPHGGSSYHNNSNSDTSTAAGTGAGTGTTLTRSSSAVKQALSEAVILATLRHPNTGTAVRMCVMRQCHLLTSYLTSPFHSSLYFLLCFFPSSSPLTT